MHKTKLRHNFELQHHQVLIPPIFNKPYAQRKHVHGLHCKVTDVHLELGHKGIRLNILDTNLIYLFLTSFLPTHSMHCPTPYVMHHLQFLLQSPCVFHVCTSYLTPEYITTVCNCTTRACFTYTQQKKVPKWMHVNVSGGSHVKLEDGRANLQCCGRISYRNKTTAPLYIRKRHTAKHIHVNTKSRKGMQRMLIQNMLSFTNTQ